MPATTTRILLSQSNWEKQHLLDKITGEVSDEYFNKANVLNPFADPIERDASQNLECNICFTEISKEVNFQLYYNSVLKFKLNMATFVLVIRILFLLAVVI